MDQTSAQQSSLLREGPMDVKAKAHSVTPVTVTGIDSVSSTTGPSPTGPCPLAATGNTKENCVGFCVLHLLLQSPAVTHDMLQISADSIRYSYAVEPQRVLL